MKYYNKETRSIRRLTSPASILLVLLIAVSVFPTAWKRSVALCNSDEERYASNTQNQRPNIGIALYKPEVRPGVINPVAFADRLIAALGREIGVKSGSVENAADRARAKKIAESLGFNFILFTTLSGGEAKASLKKSIWGVFKKTGPLNRDGDNENSEPKFKVEVVYELEAVNSDDILLKDKAQGESRDEEDAVAKVVRRMAFSIINKARETIALQSPASADPAPRLSAEPSGNPIKAPREHSKDKPRLVVQTSHSTWVIDYAYSPDGSLLATMGSDGVVKLWSATRRKEINTFPGFRTVGMTFSPDGKNLAILSKEGIVRIFDTATGDLIRKMSELTVSRQDGEKKDEIGGIGLMNITPVSMAYDPDGSLLVTGGERGIRIWDVSSGRTKQTMPGSAKLLALSPDGKIVASAPENNKSEIKLLATSDGAEISTVEAGVEVVTAMAFSHDGKSLVYGSRNGSIKLLNVSSKEITQVIVDRCDGEFARAKKIRDWVTGLGLGDKAKDIIERLPLACQIDRVARGTFKQGEAKEGWTQKVFRAGMNYWARSIRSVSLNKDGDLIAYVSGDNVIRTRSVSGNRELYQLGKSLFASQTDKSAGESSKKPKKDDKPKAAETMISNFFFKVPPVKFSADGKYLNGVAAFKTVSRWNAQTGEEVSALAVSNRDLMGGLFLPIPLGAIPIFTRDGNSIFTASLTRGTKLWDLKRGAEPRQVSGILALNNKTPLSPDGRLIASLVPKEKDPILGVAKSMNVSISDFISGRELHQFEFDDHVFAAYFSPDQRFIAIHLYQDGPIVKLYEVPPVKTLLDQKTDSKWNEVFSRKDVTRFEFSGDSQRFACLFNGEEETDEIKVFNIAVPNEAIKERKEIFTKKIKSLQDRLLISRMIFSSDGKLLAAIDGNSIKVWDITSNKPPLEREVGYTEDLSNLIFAPGKPILSYTTYHSLYHWDLESKEDSKAVRRSSIITDFWGNLSYNKEGNILALGGAENRIRLFDIEEDKEIGSLIVPGQEDWLIVTPEGRLDTNRLDDVQEVHWIMPDAPFDPLPLEIFMKDYYQPTLLQRLISIIANKKEGENEKDRQPFPPIPDLASRNRVRPIVKILGVKSQNAEGDLVTVDVEVTNNVESVNRDGIEKKMYSGVSSLRLLRDGQQVGIEPKSGSIKLESDRARILFRDIKTPRRQGIKSVEFSAYAFNSDGVKSETARLNYETPPSNQNAERRAYILTMGVGVSPIPGWGLNSTVPDARAIEKMLVEKLSPNYEVTPISLLSTGFVARFQMKSCG